MRFFATRLNGDGTETLIEDNLPLSGVSLTNELSAPDSITCSLRPEIPWLQRDGRPILIPWSTAIYAEEEGTIRLGSIVSAVRPKNDTLGVETIGFTSYIKGMPWANSTRKYYNIDPANLIWRIWKTVQEHPYGNLGLQVDEITTKVKVGVKVTEVKNKAGTITTEGKDEPILLADYATSDLAQVQDELLEAGSIDYREKHTWAADGSIQHRMELGSPRLGRRRTDISFDTRVNCATVPELEMDVEDYASEVLLLCAGEGDKMVRAHARNPNVTRLRKVHVRDAKHIGRLATAQNSAAAIVKSLNSDFTDVSQIEVVDHALAPAFSWEVGDEVPLVGPTGWGGYIEQFVRILAQTYSPESNVIQLQVVRSDKI